MLARVCELQRCVFTCKELCGSHLSTVNALSADDALRSLRSSVTDVAGGATRAARAYTTDKA
jgi:hypothetical protein